MNDKNKEKMINDYYLSFDISTTNVGIALWDNNGNLVELKHLELKVDKYLPKEDRYLYKADLFRQYLKDFKERIENEYNCNIINIFVEAPLSNTSININTTALLLGFNGIACYILYEEFKKPPILISIHNSRKLFCPELIKTRKKRNGEIKETLSFPKGVDKKYYIWKKVNKLEPEIEWFYKRDGGLKTTNFDLSDSYCVGIAGLIVIGLINNDNWKKNNSKYL